MSGRERIYRTVECVVQLLVENAPVCVLVLVADVGYQVYEANLPVIILRRCVKALGEIKRVSATCTATRRRRKFSFEIPA